MVFVFRVKYGESKAKKEEIGEAPITAKGVPVKQEEGPTLNQQLIYLLVSLFDLECSRGFRHAEMVKRQGGKLVLTDEAVAISEDPARIPGFVWDKYKMKEKVKDSAAIKNLWTALSEHKKKLISFKSPENAQIAYDILREAGFTEDMLKISDSKRSVWILGLPEKFNIEALTARLAKNLERVKTDNAKAEEAELADAKKKHSDEIAKSWAEEWKIMEKYDVPAAAQWIADTYNNPSPSGVEKFWAWYYMNLREDRDAIVKELRGLWPFKNLTDGEFTATVASLQTDTTVPGESPMSLMNRLRAEHKGTSDSQRALTVFNSRIEKPVAGVPTIMPMQKGKIGTGKEQEELRAYEKERRGGKPSLPEIAAVTPWKIDPVFKERLDRKDAVVLYAFPSLQGYAEARATVEALYPDRAIEVEHTPEIKTEIDPKTGKAFEVDRGEWTIKVHPPGETINPGLDVAKSIRANTGKMADVHVSWKHGTKRESLTVAAAAYDAVNNNSTYTTEVTIDTSDPKSMPNWFRPLVSGKQLGNLKENETMRKVVLAKGADITIELDPSKTQERRDGSHIYVYKVTISGEEMRKELQIARNKVKTTPKELPPPELKEVAFGEEEVSAKELQARLDRFRKKIKPA